MACPSTASGARNSVSNPTSGAASTGRPACSGSTSRSRSTPSATTSFAPGSRRTAMPAQAQDNTAWAVFASGDFDVTERFKLRGGLRYTDDKKDFTAVPRPAAAVQPAGRSPPISVRPQRHNVSWDLSGTYAVSDQTSVYARVATGFRAPSVQGRLLFADFTPARADYVTIADTETVLSWEAGLKSQLVGRPPAPEPRRVPLPDRRPAAHRRRWRRQHRAPGQCRRRPSAKASNSTWRRT